MIVLYAARLGTIVLNALYEGSFERNLEEANPFWRQFEMDVEDASI